MTASAAQSSSASTGLSTRAGSSLQTYAGLLLFTALAGAFWRDLISWWGYGVLAGLLAAGSIIALVHVRPTIAWRRMPKALGIFLAVSALSIAWSHYRGIGSVGVAIQWIAVAVAGLIALTLTWHQIVAALATALRWILGLSLLFELIVSVFVRHPIVPFWVDYGDGKLPNAFYWSRDLLFQGGQIQGILGNSNLLAMCALLALIVFGIQLADRTVRRTWGIGWVVVALLTLALARSSTVLLAAVFTGIVLLAALWTRAADPTRRAPIYGTVLVVALACAAALWAFWDQLLQLLGKSDDLTGRLDIWSAVTGLAEQHPVAGWGWISYWAPWVEPFDGLAVRHGVTYLQAHNAWLDVWLQLGIIGLIVFIGLVVSTLWRSWFMAVDRPRIDLDAARPFTATTLFPLLTMVALIAQSAAESRILEESGWMLLVILTIKTKHSSALG